MTKAARIIHLLSTTDLTNKQIAEVIGCVDAYVRTVQQRLANGGDTVANRRWRKNNKDKYLAQQREKQQRRYQDDGAYRARKLAANKAARDRQKELETA